MATPYTPVLIWANTDAQNGFFHEKNDIKSGLVKGVMSCWAQDVSNYSGDEHRDEPVAQAAGAGDFEATGATGDYVIRTNADSAPPVITTVNEASAILTASDQALHIPPRPTLHKDTMLTFWNDAAGTGSVLYFCRMDKYISFEVSVDPPTFIQ